LLPLGESGGSFELHVIAQREVSFLVEVVTDKSVDGGNFLQTSHPHEAKHRPFSAPKRLARILCTIVHPPTNLPPI
jgi:hypothetical protein